MTEYWGPNLWHLMHTVSYNTNANFSNVERQMLSYFYRNIGNMIPCIFCKTNYKQHLFEYPIDNYLENKSTLSDWVVKIHNIVNKSTNKKIYDNNEAYELHKIISGKKIINILNFLSKVAFMDNRPKVLNHLLNFFRNLQYVFPTQNGRDLLIFFFKKYPITVQYKNVNYFRTWYYNLERLMIQSFNL